MTGALERRPLTVEPRRHASSSSTCSRRRGQLDTITLTSSPTSAPGIQAPRASAPIDSKTCSSSCRRPGRDRNGGAPVEVTDAADARILDRGYRRYHGARRGVQRRDAHGHRAQHPSGARHQAPPGRRCSRVLTCCSPTSPPSSSSASSRCSPRTTQPSIQTTSCPPTPSTSATSRLIFVFSAFVAPEMLCTDRRTGMLGLYLASPLNRNTYLVAKAIASPRSCRSSRSGRCCSCCWRT